MNQKEFDEAMDEMKKGFESMWNGIGKAFTSMWDDLKDDAKAASTKAGEKVTDIRKTTKAAKKK
jgi:hypothetical protein